MALQYDILPCSSFSSLSCLVFLRVIHFVLCWWDGDKVTIPDLEIFAWTLRPNTRESTHDHLKGMWTSNIKITVYPWTTESLTCFFMIMSNVFLVFIVLTFLPHVLSRLMTAIFIMLNERLFCSISYKGAVCVRALERICYIRLYKRRPRTLYSTVLEKICYCLTSCFRDHVWLCKRR